MIVVLEGGYNLLNVGSGCAAIARVLLEHAPLPLHASECSVSEQGSAALHSGTMPAIREACRQHAKSWPFLCVSESTEPCVAAAAHHQAEDA